MMIYAIIYLVLRFALKHDLPYDFHYCTISAQIYCYKFMTYNNVKSVRIAFNYNFPYNLHHNSTIYGIMQF